MRRFAENGEIFEKFQKSAKNAEIDIKCSAREIPQCSVWYCAAYAPSEEMLIMIDAARRGGAERITAVLPIYGYARGGPR